MDALPDPAARTVPSASTVATLELELDHVMAVVTPETFSWKGGSLLRSVTSSRLSAWTPPEPLSPLAGTEPPVFGTPVPAFTRTMHWPFPFPSVTVMVAVPAEMATTLPFSSTEAIPSSLLDQV